MTDTILLRLGVLLGLMTAGSAAAPLSASSPPPRIAAMAIGKRSGYTYTWYTDGTSSEGAYDGLARYRPLEAFDTPPGKSPEAIVGIVHFMIRPRHGNYLVYYLDGTFTRGNALHTARYSAAAGYPYSLPDGRTPADILALAGRRAEGTLRVYAFYRDGTFSVGTTDDLAAEQPPRPFTLPEGLQPTHLAAAATNRKGELVAWYDTGVFTIGVPSAPASLQAPRPYRTGR